MLIVLYLFKLILLKTFDIVFTFKPGPSNEVDKYCENRGEFIFGVNLRSKLNLLVPVFPNCPYNSLISNAQKLRRTRTKANIL